MAYTAMVVDKIKDMASLQLETSELCKSLETCNKYIKQI